MLFIRVSLSCFTKICAETTWAFAAWSGMVKWWLQWKSLKGAPVSSVIRLQNIWSHAQRCKGACSGRRQSIGCYHSIHNELCQHQPQSWNKECAFALMKQLSHSPLLLPTTTILHRYLWVRENICRLINSTNTRLSFGVHILHRLVWCLNIYLTRAIIWTNNLCSSLLDNYWRWCTLMDRYRNPLLFSGENLAHIYVETSHWCPQNSLY